MNHVYWNMLFLSPVFGTRGLLDPGSFGVGVKGFVEVSFRLVIMKPSFIFPL